jgi:hypothetical protein
MSYFSKTKLKKHWMQDVWGKKEKKHVNAQLN